MPSGGSKPRLSHAIPVLPVRDTEGAAGFYRDRLGFRIDHVDANYAVLARDAVELHLWAATDASWRDRDGATPVVTGAETFLAGTASCRVFVDDIEALCTACLEAGIVHPNGALSDKPYGLREFAVLDRDGNLVTFCQRVPG